MLRQTTQLRIIINAKRGEASQGYLIHYEGVTANKIIYDSHLLTGVRREFYPGTHYQEGVSRLIQHNHCRRYGNTQSVSELRLFNHQIFTFF